MGLARTTAVLGSGLLAKAALRLGLARSLRVAGLPVLLDALARGQGVVTVCNHISTSARSF
jgi:lauroyl/myristoyl acyltransferase